MVIAAHDTLLSTSQSVSERTTVFALALARGRRSHNRCLANSRAVCSDSVRSSPADLDLRALTLQPLPCPFPSHRTLALPPPQKGHPCFQNGGRSPLSPGPPSS